MTWLKSNRERRTARPFIPRLESLDERTLPVSNFSVVGNTLIIKAPTTPFGPAANRIIVEDNGTNGVNNVRASTNGRTFRPNTAISNVIFRGGAGFESITYNLTGSLLGTRNVEASLGGSSDRFQITARRDFVANSALTVLVNGGAGDDNLSMNLIGNLTVPSTLVFGAAGGAGNDSVSFRTTSSVTVGATSSIALGLSGNGGSDSINTEYNGRLNGQINFFNDGGGGGDSVRAVVSVFSGSVGALIPSAVLGGAGDDTLRFVVRNDSNVAITFNQLVDGNGGIDSCVRTNDVFQLNCEFDDVI